MIDKIEKLKEEIQNCNGSINDAGALEDFRLKYLSRHGQISILFEDFKSVDKENKGKVGKALNELKNLAQGIYDEKKASLDSGSTGESGIDITLPGRTFNVGTKHLVTQALEEITSIFAKIGFTVYDGLELEDEYHNFDALNTPEYHPSRDMQDTFYLKNPTGDDKRYVLRTHTSPGQIRVMEENKPPVRVIVPGRCFRNEAISARSLEMFNQVEGLYVDKNVTLSELKATLQYFVREFYGKDLKTRFRPSYFPFTEPSAEMDVECYLCEGKGCRVCKHTGWLEILGCGMVDPEVFKHVGYDPEVYTGYAFGMGIERTLMVRHGIPDIRMFYENDIRFLKQFK
ncbi:MAG: phenylalanine--tRNA ligase subunit alpha [Ignavibacteriae bacterium]|nr:phenylalanine--tRNA ligase subunit alpha [Ignavibacteriota bacterium]